MKCQKCHYEFEEGNKCPLCGHENTFEATVEFELPFDTVVMIFSSAPYSYWLYGIDDYIGSETKIFEITVYEP